MYERFTDRARKVMQFANQEAQRFGHERIDGPHILIALAKEGSGLAAEALAFHRAGLGDIRRAVERLLPVGPHQDQVVLGKLPHTPEAKKIIEASCDAARSLNHDYVGTEHLLLGVLAVEGTASQILAGLGVTADQIRGTLGKLLNDGAGSSAHDAGAAWDAIKLDRGSLLTLPPGFQVHVVQPERLAVKCGSLVIEAIADQALTGTVKLDGVEQDWISELTIHWKVGQLPTVTLTGPVLPPKADKPTIAEPEQ